MGLSTKKEFREAQSRVNRKELGNYKIVSNGDFAFVPTTDTWKVLAFSFNDFGKDLVVSPIYEVFSIKKKNCYQNILLCGSREKNLTGMHDIIHGVQ